MRTLRSMTVPRIERCRCVPGWPAFALGLIAGFFLVYVVVVMGGG